MDEKIKQLAKEKNLNLKLIEKIIEFIKKRGMTYIEELSKELGVSRVTLRTYLMFLEYAGVVEQDRKVGRAVVYRLNKSWA